MPMSNPDDSVSRFYLEQLQQHGGQWQDRGIYVSDCPFCGARNPLSPAKLVVTLAPSSFFHGYFRCLSRCTPGGFAQHFGALVGLAPETVPGYDPDADSGRKLPDYPVTNVNGEMISSRDRLREEPLELFQQLGISREVIAENQVGFNGRYLTYPYIQADGNCYSIRCVHPERDDDFFWQGDERFSRDPYRLFNLEDIARCADGALFLVEGEQELLLLKQMGYPGIAVPHHQVFEAITPELLHRIRTVFVLIRNSAEGMNAAGELAARVGFKVRILPWPSNAPRHFGLCDLAREQGRGLRQALGKMIRSSTAFSPFASPEHEYLQFLQKLKDKSGAEYSELRAGFPLFDAALDGVHGINVLGGAPKVGKSAFAIQVASQMALAGIPVLYYDFENGRQQLYQRILSRLSRLEVKRLTSTRLQTHEQEAYRPAITKLRRMLDNFRIINDRKVKPELMRRHVDFLRHETRKDYVVVVIDSLHKLPFKNLTERRTGIDAWLRELESIRDEMQVSFLVISELSRGTEKAYSETPHLGVFKGSGDIEYSADNAMVLFNDTHAQVKRSGERSCVLHLVASREHSPGAVARYRLDYPYWGFIEEPLSEDI